MTEIVPKKGAAASVDQELLAEAQDHLGGVPEAEAINAALKLFVEHWRERRGRAFDRLQAMADDGGFNFDAIDETDR
ncbi:type II toxin-antitoxin system VapB family antitoxin [Dactylosporangium sp. McL0621]|uniref:type II toxin-antitoxin system VapB family antitoxin n=1 Tax=Dactylosporangium sp. McL0621 TaxID=3415678 RepID=UPI003CECF34A